MNGQISAASLLLELSKRADAAEVYEVRSRRLPVRFRAGALESVKSVETAGRAVRVLKDGRLGFSSTTDVTSASGVVDNALASAQYGDAVALQFPAAAQTKRVQCFDRQIAALDPDQLIALGEEMVDELQAYDPELDIEVSLDKQVEEISLSNTSGLDVQDQRTTLTISIEATRTGDDDILTVYDAASSRHGQGVDARALVQGILDRLRWAETTVPIRSGSMPVVFRQLASLSLLLPLQLGLNGKYVYQGASPLGDKLGQRAFDARLTLTDDSSLDYATLSAPCDDEGTPTGQRSLIERGIIRHFLYDLRTAAQAGARSTGNGFRSAGLFERDFRQPPRVTPATWVVSPGDQSLEEILGGLDEALLIEQVIGLGQGNVLAGEFSNNVSLAFLVRRGQISGRVKVVMVAGNAYEMLKDRVIGLGNVADWIFGALKVPAIALDAVSVASKG
jgi:PmbA protein